MKLQRFVYGCLILILLSACEMEYATVVPSSAATQVKSTPTAMAIATTPTPIVTLTPSLTPTPLLSDPMGTIALDFIALLCDADWMNGAQHLTPCPGPGADQSGGYAAKLGPPQGGLPANTSVLLMVPNAGALFLRYPPLQ